MRTTVVSPARRKCVGLRPWESSLQVVLMFFGVKLHINLTLTSRGLNFHPATPAVCVCVSVSVSVIVCMMGMLKYSGFYKNNHSLIIVF